MNNTTHESLLIAGKIQGFCRIVFYQILKFRCLILINFTWINTTWNQKTQLLFLNSVILWFIVELLWASVTAVLNPFIQLSLPSNKASSSYIMSIPFALECPIITLIQCSTRLSLAFSLPPDHSIILFNNIFPHLSPPKYCTPFI